MNSNFFDEGVESSPRSTHEIKQQLADFEKVRKLAENYGTPDFASTLGMQSICNLLDSLQQELRVAEWLEQKADVERVRDYEKRITASYSGILVGGNIDSGRFDLKIGDKMMSGKISQAANISLRNITFGAHVTAEVQVSTINQIVEDSQPETSYTLVSVRAHKSKRKSWPFSSRKTKKPSDSKTL